MEDKKVLKLDEIARIKQWNDFKKNQTTSNQLIKKETNESSNT